MPEVVSAGGLDALSVLGDPPLHLAEACAAGGDQQWALRHLAAAEEALEPSTARLSQAELEANRHQLDADVGEAPE